MSRLQRIPFFVYLLLSLNAQAREPETWCRYAENLFEQDPTEVIGVCDQVIDGGTLAPPRRQRILAAQFCIARKKLGESGRAPAPYSVPQDAGTPYFEIEGEVVRYEDVRGIRDGYTVKWNWGLLLTDARRTREDFPAATPESCAQEQNRVNGGACEDETRIRLITTTTGNRKSTFTYDKSTQRLKIELAYRMSFLGLQWDDPLATFTLQCRPYTPSPGQ